MISRSTDVACGEVPDLFFSEDPADVDQATRICFGCLARGGCLSYALMHEIEFGVWGGTTPEERQALRNTRKAA